MNARLAGIGAKLWAWLVAIAAAVVAIFGMYRNALKKGELDALEDYAEAEIDRIDNAATTKVKQAQAQAALEVETIKAAKDEMDKVNRLSDDDVTNKLFDRWARD